MSENDNLILPPEDELEEELFCAASGPGGQNVNRTASAARLTWNFAESSFLSEEAGKRMFEREPSGIISIVAKEYRSALSNRRAARERLSEIIAAARKIRKKRKATKPTYASKLKRLENKTKRSQVKQQRKKVNFD